MGSAEADAGESLGAEAVDGGGPDGAIARSVEARAEESRRARDAGPLDPRCEGMALALEEVLAEPRCAADGAPRPDEGSALGETASDASAAAHASGASRGAGGGGATEGAFLRQEARRTDPTGDMWGVTFAITNGAMAGASAAADASSGGAHERSGGAIVVPLRLQVGPSAAPSFSVVAESEAHAVYELEAPRLVLLPATVPPLPGGPPPGGAGARARPARPGPLPIEAPPLDGGARVAGAVRSLRVRLPPGGSLRARLVLDPRIVRRLDRPCSADAADCGGPLPKGRYTLHIGQLFTPLDAGPPAPVLVDLR